MSEFVPGLCGINKDFIGKYKNHIHICELKLIGNLCNHRARTIQSYCPYNIKHSSMNKEGVCNSCSHNRTIYLSDSGNEITGIE